MSWELGDIEPTKCALCGRDAGGYSHCEECREYLRVFDVSTHRARLVAERCTLELKQKSRHLLDRGKRPIEESPLFGGPAQGSMFGDGE